MIPRTPDGLSHAVKTGLQISADKHPELPQRSGRRPTEAESRRCAEFENRRDARGHQLGIDATLIASRATLLELARNWDKYAPELMNWQRELLA